MVKAERGELVQVHATGGIEPLGSVARGDLGARAGTYAVLPSPPGVLLMREIAPERVGSVRLAGEIVTPGTVCDVFIMLSQVGWRGRLTLSDGATSRSLFFDNGNVLGAQTTVEEERLGSVMYRYGVLGREDLERVARQARHGGRFGEAALELALINEHDVFRCLRHQIEEISFAAFSMASGTFCFTEGFDSALLVSHQVIAAQRLVMDGVTRMDEIRYFRERIPSAEYVPVRLGSTEPVLPEYERTYLVIDGLRSIEELGRLTGRGEFAITKDVYGLERSGHVIVQPPRRRGGPESLVELANEMLRAIHGEADSAGKGRELRKGLASFASAGTGTYGVLFLMAGPASDGAFDAQRVVMNLQRFASDDLDATLRRLLYEYVSFAVFCVGAAAGRERESELSARLAEPLKELGPQ